MSEGRRRAVAGLGAVVLAFIGIVLDAAVAATLLLGAALVLLVYAVFEPQIGAGIKKLRPAPAPGGRLFRVYRGGRPVPGNSFGSGHVGDYKTRLEAIKACRAYLPDPGPFWIEPIKFNGDPHRPEYWNIGPIEQVLLDVVEIPPTS